MDAFMDKEIGDADASCFDMWSAALSSYADEQGGRANLLANINAAEAKARQEAAALSKAKRHHHKALFSQPQGLFPQPQTMFPQPQALFPRVQMFTTPAQVPQGFPQVPQGFAHHAGQTQPTPGWLPPLFLSAKKRGGGTAQSTSFRWAERCRPWTPTRCGSCSCRGRSRGSRTWRCAK